MFSMLPFSPRSRAAVGALAIWLAPIAVSQAQAQNAVVVVNGDPITNFDIEQRIKLNTLSGGGKTPSRQDALEELINDRVKIKEGKKFNLDMSSGRPRDAICSDGRAHADVVGSIEQGSRRPRHSTRDAESAHQGGFHLVAARAWTLRPKPDRRREGRRLGDRGEGRRQGIHRQLRIQDAARGAVRAARRGAIGDRFAQEGCGNAARARAELRAGRKHLPRHARRRHPRPGGEDVSGSAGGAARAA